MNMSTASMVNESVFQRRHDLLWLRSLLRAAALVISILFMVGALQAQTGGYEPIPGDSPYVVEGVSDTIVYAVGHSLRINGTAKNGAFALGGDVIVQGNGGRRRGCDWRFRDSARGRADQWRRDGYWRQLSTR